MIACDLGTGLPTSATYIITSIMAAPALVELGVPKLVAHMFVFYFGILADLTPPTAISTYATSSIAGADVWRTQWLGMMLALSGSIIPFSFAYDPALLLINASVPHIVWHPGHDVGIASGAGPRGFGRRRSGEARAAAGRRPALIFTGVWERTAGSLLRRVVHPNRRRASGRAPRSGDGQGIRVSWPVTSARPGEVVHVTSP